MKSRVLIVSVLFFSFVLSADIGHEGDYFLERSTPVDNSELDDKAHENQGIACAEECMFFSNEFNVYCMQYDGSNASTGSDRWLHASYVPIYEYINGENKIVGWENKLEGLVNTIDITETCLNGYTLKHLGDVDYYNGKIYIPVDNKSDGDGVVIVVDEETKAIEKVIKAPRNKGNTGMPWVAVNPLDGKMYLPCFGKKKICVYNFSDPDLYPDSDIEKAGDYTGSCPAYTFKDKPENEMEIISGLDLHDNEGKICQGASFSSNGIFAASGCGSWEGATFHYMLDGHVKKLGEVHVVYNEVGQSENEGVSFSNGMQCGGFDGDFFYLHYREGGDFDKMTVYAFSDYSQADYDDDGVLDLDDNCPVNSNPEQFNFDGDNYGNACDGDIDGDGILNEDDNTPYYYDESNSRYLFCPDSDFDNVCDNERRIPPSSVNELGWVKMIGVEIFSTVDIAGGLFFAKENDDIFSITDNCPDVKNFAVEASINDELISGGCSNGVNQDGSCTMETEGGAVRNLYTMKNGYYKESGTGIFRDRVWIWQPDHDLDGIGDACDSALIDGGDGYKTVSRIISYPADSYNGNSTGDSVSGIHVYGRKYENRFVNIHHKFEGRTDNPDSSGDPDASETDISTMYCWVRDTQFSRFGDEGFCTRNDNGEFVLPSLPRFGYSHGSDPVPYNLDTGDPSWKEPVKENTEFKDKGYTVIKWDWLKNLKREYLDLYEDYVTDLQGLEDFMKYTVSSGVKESYEYLEFSHLIPDDLNGYKVNPAFFYNKKIFARAKRDETNDMKGTFLSYYEIDYDFVIPGRIYLNPYPRYPEFIDSCPECWQMPEGINGLINIWKYDYMEGILSTTLKGLSPVGETGTYLSTPDGTIAAISKYEGALVISFNRSNLSDMTVAAVTTVPSDGIAPGKAAIAGGTLYFAGENTLYTVQRMSDGFPSQTSEELPVADLVTVAQLPYPAAEMRFFPIGNDLYGLHDDGRAMSMYVLNDNEFVEAAESGDSPSSRMQGAFRVINGELYLAGGGNSYGEDIERFSDVWKYNTETGWNLIADDLDMETLDLFMESDGENLYLFSRTYPDPEVETAVVNISEGTVEYEKTEVTGDALLSTPKELCLNREGNSVFPGKLKYNQCSRFEEYQYKKYSFFDYKFSLSGKDRYLFSGGLSGIRTFKIRNNGKLKKTHFKTLGLINSIAISGSTLFAAGGNRVYIFKIGENGKLKKTGSIKTDECWNIRVENGYLFTGEDGKVKIYDIRTNSTPRLIKKVSLSYNVKDLEVRGNSLFVYHEAGWWFWKKNEIQKIDITDVYNPVKLNKISFECTDVEFTKDRGTIYMGCKNGQKEIVEDGDSFSLKTVGGKKNYFRDSYFYNGVGYTVHSGSIYLSK